MILISKQYFSTDFLTPCGLHLIASKYNQYSVCAGGSLLLCVILHMLCMCFLNSCLCHDCNTVRWWTSTNQLLHSFYFYSTIFLSFITPHHLYFFSSCLLTHVLLSPLLLLFPCLFSLSLNIHSHSFLSPYLNSHFSSFLHLLFYFTSLIVIICTCCKILFR